MTMKTEKTYIIKFSKVVCLLNNYHYPNVYIRRDILIKHSQGPARHPVFAVMNLINVKFLPYIDIILIIVANTVSVSQTKTYPSPSDRSP